MENCYAYTLVEATEQFCLHQFNDKRKNFRHYLAMAKLVWQDIFLRTLWSTQTRWVEVHTATPYPYLELPEGLLTFLGLYQEDCGRLVPLHGDPTYAVTPPARIKRCGCRAACHCSPVCGQVGALSFATRELQVGGATYTEKTWTEVTPAGDLVRWREVPAEVAGANSVEVVKVQETICKLELAPCGCVVASEDNHKKLAACGCDALAIAACEPALAAPAYSGNAPRFAFSECGTRVHLVTDEVRPQYLVHFQSLEAVDTSLIPAYCLDGLLLGIEHRSKMVNPRVHPNLRRAARNDYMSAKQDIIQLLNPISLEELFRLQGELKQW